MNTEQASKNIFMYKKREYGKNRYLNMSAEKKQRLKEYRKTYRQAKKSQNSNE